jgi:hypothetical protein
MSFWPFTHSNLDVCGVVVGDGQFGFSVVGESHYQLELEGLCGGKTKEGAHDLHAALLLPEPSNPYDKHAVCVKIRDIIVGYLSRDVALDFIRAMNNAGFDRVASEAIIIGGWHRRGAEDGYFGVRLNAVMPFKFLTASAYLRNRQAQPR